MSPVEDFEYGMDPVGRTRMFGIYKGKVIDINDPLKKQRLKVKVSQVTGKVAVTGWAESCQPVTNISNHPDHKEHLASEVAALLTTVPVTTPDPFGTTYIPALTVVPVQNPGTLKHPHKDTVSKPRRWNDAAEDVVEEDFDPDSEHTHHRLLPKEGQEVWVMFVGGDPDYPVWLGVVL